MRHWWTDWQHKLLPGIFMIFVLGGGCTPLPPQPTLGQKLLGESLIDKGVINLRAYRFDEAQAAFAMALELGGRSAAALDGLGCVAMVRGEYSQAVELFAQAVQADPQYPAVYGNLGLLYDLAGRHEDSAQLYQYALSLSPENFKARNNFAALLYDTQKEDSLSLKVREELLKALAVAPDPIIKKNLELVEEN